MNTLEQSVGKFLSSFHILKNEEGKFYWHLKAANGEIVANGETYSNKADCDHAIGLVKLSKDAPVIDRTGKNGEIIIG